MNVSASDVIAIGALLVSIGASIQAHFANMRAAKSEKRAEELSEISELRRLTDEIILEAHALSDDVRLHGGAVVKTKQRAKMMEIKSGAYHLSSTALILNECEGKRIEAEDTLQIAQPVMSGGETNLKGRSPDELRTLLRDLKKARSRISILNDETRELVRD